MAEDANPALPALVERSHAVQGGKGREVVVLDAGVALIEQLAAGGRAETSIAAALGLSPKTFRRAKREDPRVATALEVGHGRLSDELTGLLLSWARKGCRVSALFLAKTRLHWRDQGQPVRESGSVTNVSITLPAALEFDDYMRRRVSASYRVEEGEGEVRE
ncbi:MAG: hypothetical protein U0167_19525 [bacterium]